MATINSKPSDLFNLLRTKSIIEILDGDKNFGEVSFSSCMSPIKVSMPYLSGPVICDISGRFGLTASYSWGGGSQSRWSYLDDLLKHCIDHNSISDLLSYLFSKNQFVEKLKGCSPSDIEATHKQIVENVLEHINSILYFGGNELRIAGKQFQIRPIGSTISVAAPAVRKIDRSYISDLGERAVKDIDEKNYDIEFSKFFGSHVVEKSSGHLMFLSVNPKL